MRYANDEFGDIIYLAKEYGTPLVLYSEGRLNQHVRSLTKALPERSSLAYSIKANPNPSIISCMHRLGLMCEAASEGELALALKAGVTPEKLFLGGSAKNREEIELAVDVGISAILVESLNDLKLVRSIAKDAGKSIDVLLRVNPIHLSSQSVLRMTGVPSPFGIDEEQLPEVLRGCEEETARYAGLFLYAGSQHFSAADIVANTKYLCLLAHQLFREGFPAPRVLDFGGGFGVPEDASQPELNLLELRNGLDLVFDEYIVPLTKRGLQRTVFESGRYLVSQAGIYVTRVMDMKRSRGKLFAVLDGGINNLGIRQMLYRTFEPKVEVWGRATDGDGELVTLVGPTCTPIDVVHKGCYLPMLSVGDLIVIRDFGAYTASYSPIHFCGHPWPAEVLVVNGGCNHLLRRRGMRDESCGVGYIDPPVNQWEIIT